MQRRPDGGARASFVCDAADGEALHAYVHMPAVIEQYRDFGPHSVFLFKGSRADLEQKYSEALSVFRQNLQELADVLKAYTADGGRVLFVFHPHLQHVKANASGRVWNDLVSSSVQKMCAANNFFSSMPPRR